MSPLLTTGAGISIIPLGFTRGGASDKYYIATVSTGSTSYSCSSHQTPLGVLYWGFYDQGGKHYWANISKTGTVNHTRSYSMYSYAYVQKNIVGTEDGNVYVSGMSSSFGPPNYLQPMKVNSSGTIQWQRWLGSISNTASAILGIDSSENTYVCGYQGASNTGAIFTVAKYNSSGTIQWQKYYTGSGLSYSRTDSIAVGTSAIFIGGGFSAANYQQPVGILKIDTNGAVAWHKNNYGVTAPTHVAVDSSDNVYAVRPGYVTKYNTSGTHQWTRNVSDGGSGYIGIAVDPSGNVYYATGTTTIYVLKYNSSGTIQWQRSITRSGGSLTLGSNWNNDARNVVSATASAVTLACSDNNQAILFKLPADGSITGTYTVGSLAYTIASSSISESTGSEPYSALTVTAYNQGATDGANNLSVTTPTPTYARKDIP